MNKLLLIFALFAVLSQAKPIENCAVNIVNGSAFYNLCPFARTTRFITVNNTDPTNTWNITATIGNAHAPACGGGEDVWATIQQTESCMNLSVNSPALSFISGGNESSGLRMTFPKNTRDVDQYPKNLVVDLVCDRSLGLNDTANFTLEAVTDDSIFLTATSYYGCPYFTLGQFFNFLSQNQTAVIVVFVVLGLFFNFFGLKVFHVTVFLITMIVGTFVSGILFFEFVKFGTQAWVLYVIFGACLIIGIVLGAIAVKYEKVGFFALGGYLGVIGGLLLYNAILVHMMQGAPTWSFYALMTVCAMIGGGIALILWKNVIIIATSIIGSYMTVRAISVLIGGFPNEILVLNNIESINGVAYAYMAGILLKAFLGMYFQFKQKAKDEEKEEEDNAYKAYRKA